MEKLENDKFNSILIQGYEELVKVKPEKPLEHFIHFLLTKIPEEKWTQDQNLTKFHNYYKKMLNNSK